MHILYKRFGDAGLKDAVIQSGAIAEGSVDVALCGKCYNRVFVCISCFMKPSIRLIIDKIVDEIDENDWLMENQASMFDKVLYEDFKQSEQFQDMYNRYLDLKIQWSLNGSDLKRFWLSFIDMVNVLLGIIFACHAESGIYYLSIFTKSFLMLLLMIM